LAEIPEIELRGIRTIRGDYVVLNGIDLSLSRGETLFVMGNAGSGKSVLVKTAAGIALPTEGEILYKGKSLARMSEREEAAFRKASGFVFQEAALWANQNLYDNLALPARLHRPDWGKAELDRAVRGAAEIAGYDQDLYVRPVELSTGERKLIGLARALVLDPELLFMDDPTSELDESAAARIFDIVEAVKARGHSVLVTSGVSEFASRCADRIAVLLGGKLAAVGGYDEAAAWTDPGVRSVTGRLKARVRAEKPAWEDSLAGAWASAVAENFAPEETEAAPWKKAQDSGRPGETLGDIINDVTDVDSEPEGGKKDGS
jgi:phospholipid/cholesterol/gamma-HCH transport system ATP-binding protein